AVDGTRLVDAMAGAGFDAHRAAEAKAPAGAVASYVELHIEQGPRLEEAGVPIGVVEAIVGVRRSRVIFVGQAGHAGTTPTSRRRSSRSRGRRPRNARHASRRRSKGCATGSAWAISVSTRRPVTTRRTSRASSTPG